MKERHLGAAARGGVGKHGIHRELSRDVVSVVHHLRGSSVDIDYDAYLRIDKGGGANQAGVFWVSAPPDLVNAL